MQARNHQQMNCSGPPVAIPCAGIHRTAIASHQSPQGVCVYQRLALEQTTNVGYPARPEQLSIRYQQLLAFLDVARCGVATGQQPTPAIKAARIRCPPRHPQFQSKQPLLTRLNPFLCTPSNQQSLTDQVLALRHSGTLERLPLVISHHPHI